VNEQSLTGAASLQGIDDMRCGTSPSPTSVRCARMCERKKGAVTIFSYF
jgi:hypothetical protein